MIDYLNYGKQVQSIVKEPKNEPKIQSPIPCGWSEYKLNQTELNYVWSCVNHKENEWTQNLVFCWKIKMIGSLIILLHL